MKIDLQEVAKKRTELLIKAENNPAFQQFEIDCCKNDILYWYRNYVWTDTNTSLYYWQPSSIPFIPYPFQEEAITEIRSSIYNWTLPPEERYDLTNVLIEKSRQMGLSWIIMWIFVYWFVFHNHKYHCISQKEDDVDKTWNIRSLMEKCRFILNNMPKWMVPEWYKRKIGTDHNKHLVISAVWRTGSITGESANPNAWRSWTYNAIFKDEMAFMQNARAINMSTPSATPCRIFNSTPNWEGNEFYRMRQLSLWRKWDNWQDIEPEIKWLRYHWSEHPLYDDKWYKEKIKGMTPEQIAQELEIDYNTALEWRVYKNFPSSPEKIMYNPLSHVYVWLDNSHWWVDPHALIVAQLDNLHYINILDAIEVNCSVTEMAEFVSWSPRFALSNAQLEFLERFKIYNPKKAIYVSDPYDTHATLNQSTIYEEYRKVGIHLNIPMERRKEHQIMITQSNLYKIRYSDNCLDFASAILNARYPPVKENSTSTSAKTKPIHDWTSHFRTAMEYWVVYIHENPAIKKERVVQDDRVRKDPITREIFDNRSKNTIISNNYRAQRDELWRLIYNS